ncbi:hypothetical protein DF200_08500 [Bifidobacterium catulorum]|uniref:Uncharacterized protein n=1 Tax=Bifidobacterium catulorum TaxID=1630173 RepID=A0A2U2MQZ1_9BIFI|nr:hypothetical protein DF200_08500 [Bifidobacterium catulorum]
MSRDVPEKIPDGRGYRTEDGAEIQIAQIRADTTGQSANGTWLESRGRRTQLTARVRAHMLPGDVVWFGDKWAKLSMTT